jgi:hypothetical protein
MNELQRQALLTACAFAKVFMDAADHEIKGGDASWREESAMHLAAALRNLTTPPDVPVVDWTEPLPQHIDSDRHRGPSDWDRECQESRRLNR